jgi:mannose-6-phosphate isomerase-like protein (cupin superfamily)
MRVLNRDSLPFRGMSHRFTGEDHGTSVSFYLVEAPPGRGPALHTHPYDEILVMQEGEATCVVGDETGVLHAGDIVVVPAGTPHSFVNTGTGPLRQMDIHVSPTFVQHNVEVPNG